MEQIIIKDNDSETTSEKQSKILQKIANQKLSELTENYPDILIFPNQLGEFKDDIESSPIFSLSINDKGTTLQAGNVAGFIGIKDDIENNYLNLRIHSRFDKDTKQYFLQYMLMKVFCPTILDFPTSADNENISDFFLALLFPYYLQKALKQGVFKQYQKYEYNDSNVKGKIDISRHLKNNLPFLGSVAYSCREFSFDNPITQLIHHTLDYLESKKWIFDKSSIFNQNKHLIYLSTPSWHRHDKQKIIEQNRNKLNHPYFTEYEPLRKICLRILKSEGISFASKNEKVYGVLFDVAWLWEEYLNTIFSKQGFIHPQNKIQKDAIYLFDNNSHPRFPDFYKGCKYILDAKYKKLDYKSEKDMRDDLHQIITYIHILKSEVGIFIYPSTNNTNNKVKLNDIGTLKGYGGIIKTIAVQIPQNCNSFNNFSQEMKNSEVEFEKIFDLASI